MLRLGVVVGTHGLKGALKVKPLSADPDSWGPLTRLYLDGQDQPREFRLLELARASRGHFKVLLEGIDSIEQAESLRGASLMANPADFPPLGPGEFYYFELVGFAVRTTGGEVLGTIAEIFHNGAHDVWIVRDGPREILVPVIEDIVRKIDRANRCTVIEPMEGLLE